MVYDSSMFIYIPVLYILMTGKTEECYHQAFTYIHGELPICDSYCIGVDFGRAFSLLRGHSSRKLIYWVAYSISSKQLVAR